MTKKLSLHNYLPFDEKKCEQLCTDFRQQFKQIYIDKKHFYEINQNNKSFIDCLLDLPEGNTELEDRTIAYLLLTFYRTSIINTENSFDLILNNQFENKISEYFKKCYEYHRNNPNKINYIEKVNLLLNTKNSDDILMTNLIQDYASQFDTPWKTYNNFFGIFNLLNEVLLLKKEKKLSNAHYEKFSFIFANVLNSHDSFFRSEEQYFFIEMASEHLLVSTDFTSKKYEGHLKDILMMKVLQPAIKEYLLNNKIIVNYETLNNQLPIKDAKLIKKQKI